jgi:hypothetical protein
MKKILTYLLLSLTTTFFAQKGFQKGHYISNSGEKIIGLIKIHDLNDTPQYFDFKISSESQIERKTIENTKEFKINNTIKLIKTTVKFDRSNNKTKYLTSNKYSDLKEQKIFLEVILENNASLYKFREGDLIKFFFKLDNKDIEYLVFKKYLKTNNIVANNNQYKQQLFQSFKNANITVNNLKKTYYNQKDLLRIFETYNNNLGFKNIYKKKKEKLEYNFTIKALINYTSLNVTSDFSSAGPLDLNFKNQTNFGIGFETEVFFPLTMKKWSIFIEPSYRRFQGIENQTVTLGSIRKVSTTQEISYNSIEIPLAVRFYYYVNNKNSFYINPLINTSIPFNSVYKTITNVNLINMDDVTNPKMITSLNFGFGIGYKYNQKISLELRYKSPSNIFSVKDPYYESKLNNIALIFGYSIF